MEKKRKEIQHQNTNQHLQHKRVEMAMAKESILEVKSLIAQLSFPVHLWVLEVPTSPQRDTEGSQELASAYLPSFCCSLRQRRTL